MLDYSNKFIIKRIYRTFIKSLLEPVGVYPCIITYKRGIKQRKQKITHYLFDIETLDGKYSDIIIVNPKDYKKYNKGDPIECSLVRNKNSDTVYISIITPPEKAISNLVINGRIGVFIFAIAILSVPISIMLMILPFLNT